MFCVSPSVFVGKMSKRVYKGICQKIEAEKLVAADFSAVVIRSDKASETGFSTLLIGAPKRRMENYDGIELVSKKRSPGDDYFAKSPVTGVTVIEHCFETAVMAETLARSGRARHLVKALSKRYNIPEDDVINTICFMAGIHDIGKIDEKFQERIRSGKITDLFRHELAGALLFKEEIEKKGLKQFGAKEDRQMLSELIIFHHQGKRHTGNADSAPEHSEQSEAARDALFDLMMDQFPVSKEFLNFDDELMDAATFYAMLSIINLADFAASDCKAFEQERFPLDTEATVGSSRKRIRGICENYIKENHLSFDPIGNRNIGYTDIAPNMQTPRPLQLTVKAEADSLGDRIKLMIVEFPMGEGKTNAALYAAMKLGSDRSGFVFSLPTAATTEPMCKTVRGAMRNIGIDRHIPMYTMAAPTRDSEYSINRGFCADYYEKQLYPMSVGTIDQILRFAFSRRYGDLDFAGLSDKVLVIDEMHVYDAYMRKAICRMTEYMAFADVPVIILSATIPQDTKKQLVRAAGYKGKYEPKTSYPLITEVYENEDGKLSLKEIEGVAVRETPPKRFSVKLTGKEPFDEMIDDAICRIRNGGVAMIRVNRVKDVIRTYRKLEKRKQTDPSLSDTRIDVIHGKNFATNKGKKIAELLTLYGEDKSRRPERGVIVCSNILDFSINISVDFILSEISPIDALLQVSGRKRRYSDAGTIFEKYPETDDAMIVYAGTGDRLTTSRIYEEETLLKTLATLMKHPSIDSHEIGIVMSEVYDGTRSGEEQKLENAVNFRILPEPDDAASGITDRYDNFSIRFPNIRNISAVQKTVIFLFGDEIAEIAGWQKPLSREQKNRLLEWSLERSIAIYDQYDDLNESRYDDDTRKASEFFDKGTFLCRSTCVNGQVKYDDIKHFVVDPVVGFEEVP